MKIALFHNLPSGGGKRAVYEWVRRLAACHEIDVFTLSSADHEFCDIRPLVRRHHIFHFSPHQLLSSPFGRLNQLQRWRDLVALERIGEQIARQIDAGGYDVVLANACRHTFIPPLLQFTRTPSVYYLHEPFGRRFMRAYPRPYWKVARWRTLGDRFDPLIGLYYHRLEQLQQKSLRATNRLLANSQFTQEQMSFLYQVDSTICYLGVDTESFYPLQGKRKEKIVLSVGELAPRKGFDFLIRSLAHVPEELRPVLRIASNTVIPEEKSYLEALAAEHQVALEIATKLSVEQLRLEYNSAQFCVYSPVAEPFGLVPLEAMACGTAVIGVREGGVQESVLHQHTGLLVDRDPRQFATAIQALLTNPGLAAEYGQNGRSEVLQHWTWENSVAHLERELCFD